jgi:hypothetical protein
VKTQIKVLVGSVVLAAALGAVFTQVSAGAAAREDRAPLDDIAGVPDSGSERAEYRTLSDRVSKKISEASGIESNPNADLREAYAIFKRVDAELGDAESDLFARIAADPRIVKLRAAWRACMGNRFESEADMVKTFEQSKTERLAGDKSELTEDEAVALSEESEKCIVDELPQLSTVFPDVVSKWKGKNSGLGAKYQKALRDLDKILI